MAIKRFKANPLPNPDSQYSVEQAQQLIRVIELYFGQVDNFLSVLSTPAKGTTANSPTVDVQVGDYYFDTTIGRPVWYNGTSWVDTYIAGALVNIVEDVTPQLGGTLDANSNSIDMGTNTITDTKVGQWDASYARPAPTMQVFTADGTWTAPSGCRSIEVTVVGGGGAGGGVDGQGSGTGVGAGGGGGAGTAIKVITSSTFGATEAVTVGSGGTGASGNSDGGGGGDSSFGSHCTGNGGGGGIGGTGSSPSNTLIRNGGSGGGGSNGDINLRGGPGGFGIAGGGSTSEASGGVGGSSFLAGGPRSRSGDYDGNDAESGGYGAGGGGAVSTGTETNRSGGDGGDGIVIVREYY